MHSPNLDSGLIYDRLKRISTSIRTHLVEDTHLKTESLTLLKPALISGITEASSLSGLKRRARVSIETSTRQTVV